MFRSPSRRRAPVNTLPTAEERKSGPFPRPLDPPANRQQPPEHDNIDPDYGSHQAPPKSPGSGKAVSPPFPRSSWRCECLASLTLMKLTVNDAEVEVDDRHARTPLLWVLRDVLGMHGTKFGCGVGYCAACAVLLDAKNTKSCQTATER